jgi:hypothetical protein
MEPRAQFRQSKGYLRARNIPRRVANVIHRIQLERETRASKTAAANIATAISGRGGGGGGGGGGE